MERILSIRELESMIKAIKKDNPQYKKRIPKHACGIFNIGEVHILEHRHIGNQEFQRVNIN